MKSFGSNKSQRCSNTIDEGPLVERWAKWMNVDLNISKENLNLFLSITLSKNLNMARTNLEDKESTKQ